MSMSLHRQPPRPPPAYSDPHGVEALIAYSPQEDDGSGVGTPEPPPARGPPQHHPHRMRPRRTPWTPLTHRTGPRTTTHDHHTSPSHSGTPAWRKTTAEQPGPPSCPGGHTVKFGACVYRTARVGYCFMFRVLVVNSFMYLMRSECCFTQ